MSNRIWSEVPIRWRFIPGRPGRFLIFFVEAVASEVSIGCQPRFVRVLAEEDV